MANWFSHNWWIVVIVLLTVALIASIARSQRKQRRYQALLDNIPDLAWVKDTQGRFTLVNQAFSDIWGVKPSKLIGKTDFDLSSRANAERYEADDQDVMAQRKLLRREFKAPNDQTGNPQWVDLIKTPVTSKAGYVIGTAGLARDISEKKKVEGKLTWLAWHDSLTKLYNRHYLEQRLKVLCQQDNEFQLVMLDLDNFKRINDALGHAAGDNVLTAVAHRLSELDAECFRLGGDEFVIIDHTQTRPLSDVLRRVFKAPFIVRKLPFRIAFTGGRVIYPHNGQSGESLLKAADVALYEGKQNGRGSIVDYRPAMSRQAMRQLELEQDLRTALLSDQFRLVYQPQVDLASGQLVGVEALIRWHHPLYGAIAPSEFIHFAEQTGVVADIGTWVLKTAIEQIRHWYHQDLPLLDVAVNVSVIQFEQPGFVDTLLTMIEALPSAAREKLNLELTESVLMNRQARAAIIELGHAGIKIVMDDFGTGYSNLSMLADLSLDKIKFDRSLIQGVASNHAKARISAALLKLIEELELDVVAEGVETFDDYQWLVHKGCPMAQGFYFSKPLEVQEVTALLYSAPVALPLANAGIAPEVH